MGLTREDFTQAVLAYQRDMYRAARAMLPCDADAEDAVSQAVLLAWQSRDRLREEDAARAWLVKITVNCARQQCRHRGRVLYLSELEPLAGGREDPRPTSSGTRCSPCRRSSGRRWCFSTTRICPSGRSPGRCGCRRAR